MRPESRTFYSVMLWLAWLTSAASAQPCGMEFIADAYESDADGYPTAGCVHRSAGRTEFIFAGGLTRVGSQAANGLVSWDGERWTVLPAPPPGWVGAVCVHEGLIHLGGRFSLGQPAAAYMVVRLTPTGWEPVGDSRPHNTSDGVRVLRSYRGDLYVGGDFTSFAGRTSPCIARWNGTAWSPLGFGVDANVRDMAEFGGELFVAGEFGYVDGRPQRGLARWDGAAWVPILEGPDGPVSSLTPYQSTLLVSGSFRRVGSRVMPGLARWSEDGWLSCPPPWEFEARYAVVGDELIAIPEGTSQPAMQWNGSQWVESPGSPLSWNVPSIILSDGVLLRTFAWAQPHYRADYRSAEWDGSVWRYGATVFSGGGIAFAELGGETYGGGDFRYITSDGLVTENFGRLVGRAWSSVGVTVDGPIRAMLPAPEGLYLAGSFRAASDGTVLHGIGLWDGVRIRPLGDGLTRFSLLHYINGLAMFQGRLIAAGQFSTESGVVNIASWDGESWRALGDGLSAGVVQAVAVYDGALYATGRFTRSGGTPLEKIAKWDGAAWSPLANGLIGGLEGRAMAVYRNELHVAGDFNHAGVSQTNQYAVWNGASWRSGSAPQGIAWSMLVHDDRLFAVFPGPMNAYYLWSFDGASWRQTSSRAFGTFKLGASAGVLRGSGWVRTQTGEQNTFGEFRPRPDITVTANPIGITGCLDGSWNLSIGFSGPVSTRLQWRRDGENLVESAELTGTTTYRLDFRQGHAAMAGVYDCVLTSECGTVVSAGAEVRICRADADCGGGIDGGDVEAYFDLWAGGRSGADLNADGGVDSEDVRLFFELWEAGAC